MEQTFKNSKGKYCAQAYGLQWGTEQTENVKISLYNNYNIFTIILNCKLSFIIIELQC